MQTPYSSGTCWAYLKTLNTGAKRSLPNLPLLEPEHRENDAFLCAVKPCRHLHISCHGNLGGHLQKKAEDTMFGSVLIDGGRARPLCTRPFLLENELN
ncbi:hypothetical protein HPP92_015708 [Vanilla planifolia]|uniref:Uncharacterized protein n=1 Tax=Vanilla planifolia TaxID=51239 RepID=A0A835QNW2_VANPL|nr:hypothetical protein HPP92_015708 [Vanilla planifolia]